MSFGDDTMDTGTLAMEKLTVNEIIRRWPDSVAVFNRFGIDACCGGAVPPAEAAARDGADPEALLRMLDAVLEGAP
jgi:iron-sulfur cluster repair protein YtfE (RIC family)